MNTSIVLFIIYPLEMFIAYIVYSSFGEKRKDVLYIFLFGVLLYECGALINIALNNTIWINFIIFFIINLIFALSSFIMPFRTALYLTLVLNIFSVSFEFATIFATSAVLGARITDYNSNFSLMLIEATVSKTLYLISCVLLACFSRSKASPDKVPRSFYLFPFCVLLSLIAFWYISANESLNESNQLLLSIVSMVLLSSTVLLFINYQHNIARENEYTRIKSENDRLQIEKVNYDILEKQNQQLMIYAHDAKNHLAVNHAPRAICARSFSHSVTDESHTEIIPQSGA